MTNLPEHNGDEAETPAPMSAAFQRGMIQGYDTVQRINRLMKKAKVLEAESMGGKERRLQKPATYEALSNESINLLLQIIDSPFLANKSNEQEVRDFGLGLAKGVHQAKVEQAQDPESTPIRHRSR